MGTSAHSVRWTSILPKSANETWWIRHHLVHRSARDNPEFAELMDKAKAIGAMIAQEDVDVNTLQRIGAKSRLAAPGRLSHLEMPVWRLADWMRDGIGESA